MSERPVVLHSLSAAMDGGFTAIHDVSSAMSAVGAQGDYRLIGGVSVMLHVQRLELDLPLRATGDADFGVPPHVLRSRELVDAIEGLGYHKVLGNRWERQLDDRRFAAVDLLIPTYRTRARQRATTPATSRICGAASRSLPRTVSDRRTSKIPASGASELWRQLGPEASALATLTSGLQREAAARRRTRIRALLAETLGVP